jgi:hypothetical protein
MEQLYHDVNAQSWSAIYNMPESDEQLWHFNAIVLMIVVSPCTTALAQIH